MRGFLRRRYLVRSFQYRLILFQALYFALLCSVVYFRGVLPLLDGVRDQGLTSGETDSAKSLLFFDRNVFPVLVPMVLVLFGHAVFISHRIAGPLYRFTAVLRAIATGDLSMRVRIRPGDYLQEEAREFDAAVASLRERVASAQTRARTLDQALSKVEAVLPTGCSLGEVRAAAKDLDTALDGFVLERGVPAGDAATASRMPKKAA